MPKYTICTFYKFVELEDYESLRTTLLRVIQKNKIKGTLLLSQEGINGTVASTRKGIDSLQKWLQADERFANIVYKESCAEKLPFHRSKVKLKKEIVSLGVEGVNPGEKAGAYVKPKDWNALISDPGVVLVDTRNDYEVQIGTFKNAINPTIATFREFPEYARKNLGVQKQKKVAMFCTGGIRCEKSTALLKARGFAEVYHLEGGILKYLEEVPEEHSLWQGECFVFDERVTVDHKLEKGTYEQCRACRFPVSESDKQSDKFVRGVSCPRCFDKHSPEQKARFAEREKQVQLANQRGEQHIGSDAAKLMQRRRRAKNNLKQKQREKKLPRL